MTRASVGDRIRISGPSILVGESSITTVAEGEVILVWREEGGPPVCGPEEWPDSEANSLAEASPDSSVAPLGAGGQRDIKAAVQDRKRPVFDGVGCELVDNQRDGEQVFYSVAHLTGQHLAGFLAHFSFRYIEKDPEHDALDNALVLAAPTS